MIKFTILLRRNPALTPAEFVQYHQTKHAPLFLSVPAVQQYVRRYVQGHPLPFQMPGLPAPAYDGTTELWFDTAEDIALVFADAEYLRLIRPDEAKFLDLAACDILVLTEHVVR